jgi:hypothetical protein
MFKSNHCKDCGVNTILEGFVNRVPAELWVGATLECFVCGSCTDMYDLYHYGVDDGIDAGDWLGYLAERIQYIDAKYSDAKRFRNVLSRLESQPIPN